MDFIVHFITLQLKFASIWAAVCCKMFHNFWNLLAQFSKKKGAPNLYLVSQNRYKFFVFVLFFIHQSTSVAELVKVWMYSTLQSMLPENDQDDPVQCLNFISPLV